jgi:DNA modification methylase
VAQRSTGYVLAGNHRLLAVRRDGGAQIPCFWLDCSDAEARRILSADNRTSDVGTYDAVQLAELLTRIHAEADGSLAGTGYTQDAFDAVVKAAGDAVLEAAAGAPAEETEEPQIDRAEELLAKWHVERGQIWAIGKHRLMCGDSTCAADVARLMQGERAGLMATDPPYGVAYDSAWRKQYSSGEYSVGSIANDDRADWREVWALWDVPVLYIWHGGLHASAVAESLTACKYELRGQIIWNKSVMVFGRGAYHWKHEPCWYAVKKGENANWQGDRSQTTVWDCGNGSGAGRTGDAADDFHANHISQKPVELFRRPILNHTKKGDVLAEPFAGSGSQFVAAEQLQRICYGVELEPKYCAVILERMQKLGLTPALSSQASIV